MTILSIFLVSFSTSKSVYTFCIFFSNTLLFYVIYSPSFFNSSPTNLVILASVSFSIYVRLSKNFCWFWIKESLSAFFCSSFSNYSKVCLFYSSNFETFFEILLSLFYNFSFSCFISSNFSVLINSTPAVFELADAFRSWIFFSKLF